MSQSKNGIWGMVFYGAVLLALIGLLCYGLVAPAYAQEDSRTLPILMYHDIVPEGGLLDDYTASVAQLEADLQALAQEGWQTVRLSEIITYVRMGTPLPEKPVLLVFDDGYRSILTQVLPLLQKYNACAVVSVIGARAQGVADGCDTAGQYMTWQELSQAVASGRIELQSHSAQLHVYRTRKGVQLLPEETAQAYEAMLLSDLEQMDQWSRAAGITMLRAFAYPYGYVEPLADALLQQQGYVATMTSEPHLNLITHDAACLYRLGRLNRSGLISTETLMAWLREE